jgi:hypothetical protein
MHAPAFPLIPPETLLLAYRSGIFPMADGRDDPEIFWVEPKQRAILPLGGFRCSKTLRKLLRRDRFRVTIDAAFTDVVSLCAAPRADHPDSWISQRIAASYFRLHRRATPIRSNAGTGASWSAGSTASLSTGCSAARACSAARTMPRKSRSPGWSP